MSRKDLMDLIHDLGRVQGNYWRLYAALEEASEEERNEFLDKFKDCKDSTDFVLRMECGL